MVTTIPIAGTIVNCYNAITQSLLFATDMRRGFDVDGFYRALEATMRARNLNWKQVGEVTQVHPSTLSRMSGGKKPDANSLAQLAAWSGLNPAEFVKGVRAEPAEPLARISAFVHSDPRLTKDAATALEQLIRVTYSQLATPLKIEGPRKR